MKSGISIQATWLLGITSGWSPVAVGVSHDLFVEAYGWMLYNNGLILLQSNLN